MIVGYAFDGDDDPDTQWAQHETYDRACRLLVSGCLDHARAAVTLVRIPWPSEWPAEILSYDHRVLQNAHDLLAAAWRYRTNNAQQDLFGPRETPGGRMQNWLLWLGQEVLGWHLKPHMSCAVMDILANQNTAAGYDAEDRLDGLMREHFSDVPWLSSRCKSGRHKSGFEAVDSSGLHEITTGKDLRTDVAANPSVDKFS